MDASDVAGFGGVACLLAGVYLWLGLAATLVLAGLFLMWVALRMGDDADGSV